MNFLSKLQIFKDIADWDEKREYYVPEGTDVSLPNEKWYGIKNGKYKYSGQKKWLRDYRIRMVFVTTDKPFLWGRMFPRDFSPEILKPTAEENSELFFGCKSWSDLLTDDLIYRVVNDMHLDDFRQNVIALRQAGFSKEQWVSIYKSGLHTVAPKYILDAKQHDLLHHGDLRDMIDWLDALGLTIKEAKSLWQSSNTGRKITVTFKNKPMEYKSRTPKKNLHDFLSAVILSCEKKLNQAEYAAFPASPLSPPDGFSQVKTEKELMRISKANGWCAGQKSYREGALLGRWVFFYNDDVKALAQYKVTGELMQVRGNHNSIYADTVPSKLTIK